MSSTNTIMLIWGVGQAACPTTDNMMLLVVPRYAYFYRNTCICMLTSFTWCMLNPDGVVSLLLFITAGMVVERKPCVRGEKE
jgi:hypothetical protein